MRRGRQHQRVLARPRAAVGAWDGRSGLVRGMRGRSGTTADLYPQTTTNSDCRWTDERGVAVVPTLSKAARVKCRSWGRGSHLQSDLGLTMANPPQQRHPWHTRVHAAGTGHAARRFALSIGACGVLATAGLLATGCGKSAPERKLAASGASGGPYSTTPSAAKALLSKLQPPPGFTRGTCLQVAAGKYSACFTRQPSIVVTTRLFIDLVRASGLKPTPRSLSCFPIKHFARPRLQLTTCTGTATRGAAYLDVNTTSLVLAGSNSAVGTTRTLPNVPPGTVYNVTDLGTRPD